MNTAYPTPGHVYAIRAGDTSRVKIGITRDLKARLRDLQRNETERLRVIASVESTTEHERELLRLEPGDRVIVTITEPTRLTQAHIVQLRDELKAQFAPHEVLILNGLTIAREVAA